MDLVSTNQITVTVVNCKEHFELKSIEYEIHCTTVSSELLCTPMVQYISIILVMCIQYLPSDWSITNCD